MRILRYLLRRARLCAEGLMSLPSLYRTNPRASLNPTVVIVKLDQIGDFILWLDSARRYRNLFLGKRLVLFAHAGWAALAKNEDIVDEVVPVDPGRFMKDVGYRRAIELDVYERGAEICIHPVYSRHFATGDRLVRTANAPKSIGFYGDLSNQTSWQRAISNRWYTNLVENVPSNQMELLKHARFVRCLGAKDYLANIARLRTFEPLVKTERLLVVFPGASWYGKIWSVTSFAEVLEIMHRELDISVAIGGSAAEVSTADELAGLLSFEVRNLAGKTDLAGMAQLIKSAQLVFGNDSAAIHVAAALGVPSVCILGGGHFGRFLPYQVEAPVQERGPAPNVVKHAMTCYECDWMCRFVLLKKAPFPCVLGVQVEQVVAACRASLIEKKVA